jgi:competence protein ComEA
MVRSRRFIIFLVAAGFAATLFHKGHPPSHQDGSVAFVPLTSSRVAVRIGGKVPAPGVYTFPDEVTVADVIKLTVAFPEARMAGTPLFTSRVRSGDIVIVAGENPQQPEISVKTMKAGERILLGIPLDPDQMDRADWEDLPGIGPKLARNIVQDRQIYGYFRTTEAIRRVPGMGEKKFNAIKKYFKDCNKL